jgi:hypothetical protein
MVVTLLVSLEMWRSLDRRLLSRHVDERFRRLCRIQIWRPQVARLSLDASIRFTRTGAARINTVRKIRWVRYGLQPLRVPGSAFSSLNGERLDPLAIFTIRVL